MAYVTIDPTRCDAESPITESLMSDIIGNIADNRLNGGVDGTKGSGTLGASSGAPTVIAIITSAILCLQDVGVSSLLHIDGSDDTFIFVGTSGTLTSSFVELHTGIGLYARKNGANYEIYRAAVSFNYIWL